MLFHTSIFITSLSLCDSEWLWILQCEPKTPFLFTALVKLKYDEISFHLFMCTDVISFICVLTCGHLFIVLIDTMTTLLFSDSSLLELQSLKHFCFGWLGKLSSNSSPRIKILSFTHHHVFRNPFDIVLSSVELKMSWLLVCFLVPLHLNYNEWELSLNFPVNPPFSSSEWFIHKLDDLTYWLNDLVAAVNVSLE